MTQTTYRTCHLCEATCGLTFQVDSSQILSVAPDEEDVFSRGYICPKGAAIAALHNDPDRLRQPMRRLPNGDFAPIAWDEALDEVSNRLRTVRRQHGRDAVALYMGNPIVHNHGILMLRNSLMQALGSRNCTSANSQDTAPRFCVSYYLYGASLILPVPDIDRCDYFLCLGANPRASNGSVMTAPNIRDRFKQLRARGGRLVVVDPRRTETAREADEHIAILPDGDAPLLLAMLHTLRAEDRLDRTFLERHTIGWDEIERRLPRFEPQRVAERIGIAPATIRRLARDFAAARAPVAYSRVGVCVSEHATAATFATDLLNIATGRLGAVGGWMFPKPAFDTTPLLKLTGDGHARWHTRVKKLPETLGDIPTNTLADEIETPGPGQVRALLCVAGNPVLSSPNGRRLDAALKRLEFVAAVDIYINETTRHADIILPPASSLCDDHVDLIFSSVSVRHIVRHSPAVVPLPAGQKTDWQILLDLIYRLGGGPTGVRPLDFAYRLGRKVGWHWTPDSTLDLLLRLGPFGDRFLPTGRGLNLKRLKRAPHGIDMGPLDPGIEHRILHRHKRVQLAAQPLLAGLDQLAADLDAPRPSDALLLIGRRELRSNNSWMHNIPELVRGRERCTLLVHPTDAERCGVRDGQLAVLENALHRGEVLVETSEDMRPGVVSLPHGWGHAAVAPWQRTAGAHAGVSFNDWTDDSHAESVVGQSILNGIPVHLSALAEQPATESSLLATPS